VIDNLRQRDIALAVEEVAEFTAVGGRTIVDPANASTDRDPEGIAEIARRSGLNLVMGSGYYYQVALDEAFARRSVEDISDYLQGPPCQVPHARNFKLALTARQWAPDEELCIPTAR